MKTRDPRFRGAGDCWGNHELGFLVGLEYNFEVFRARLPREAMFIRPRVSYAAR